MRPVWKGQAPVPAHNPSHAISYLANPITDTLGHTAIGLFRDWLVLIGQTDNQYVIALALKEAPNWWDAQWTYSGYPEALKAVRSWLPGREANPPDFHQRIGHYAPGMSAASYYCPGRGK